MLYQESYRRLGNSIETQLGQPQRVWNETALIRLYLMPVTLLGIFLFVLWRPPNPYVDGHL